MNIKANLNILKNEISLIKSIHPMLKDDAAFVFWFTHAYLVDKEEDALSSLTGKEGGNCGEKSIDAVYIDHNARQCNIIQAKYHTKENANEKRTDVISFSTIGLLPWVKKDSIDTFCKKLDPIAMKKFLEVIECIKKRKYKLNLFYISTGKCTSTIIEDARNTVRNAAGEVEVNVITFEKLMVLLQNYIEGIAPAVPLLKINLSAGGPIRQEGVLHRYDPKSHIETWVFSIAGNEIGNLFTSAGIRIFAKNIRGYLGSTDINNSIIKTIKSEPDNFWYYNNGVTIVCDEARREIEENEDIMYITGAQIINGQQTTRTLQKCNAQGTFVLVKVIKIPRNEDDIFSYDNLVNSIVRSTNWQNSIAHSDLIANDHIQIVLEREFRKHKYQYIRKRMSKSEARSLFGQGFWQIDKRELAQAVAACLFDPAIVRKGMESLFDNPYYNAIFSSHHLSFYFPKYWLMKQVQSVSSGYPERAYAKWLVLNIAWSILEKAIGNNIVEKRFRTACERKDMNILGPLKNYLALLFRMALKFYRKQRGKGEEAKDISTFFRLSKLDKACTKYYHSNGNEFLRKMKTHLRRFSERLRKSESI